MLWTEFKICFCACFFSVTVSSIEPEKFLNDRASKYSVRRLSSCSAHIENYGLVDLSPLARKDGFPRFATQYKNIDTPLTAIWNYSFNPCDPFNEPHDHFNSKNIFGDKCMSVSVCKFGESSGKHFYYTYGRHDSANFTASAPNSGQPPIVTLSFNGTGRTIKKKTEIRLVCDKKLYKPDDALFSIKHDVLKSGIIAELQHFCCCPGGCRDGEILHNNITTLEVSDKNKKKTDSTTLLLIVGLNVGLLLFAGVIGALCYTKKSSPSAPRIYSKLPGVHAVPSNHLNFSSIDLEKDTLEMPGNGRSSIRDYEPWSQRKKQVMMPVFEDCVIPNASVELAQRLGGGFFGDTYVGDVKGLKVAVTRITLNLHKEQRTPEMLQWLKDEVWFLSRQRHRNIVAMLGVCTDSKLPYIMSEFIEGFTVKNYIQNKGDLVSWPLRVKICLQAADGVAYLHSTKPPIIHRDLRCANLFISHHEIVKVGDFGLVKLIQPLRSLCREEDCSCQGHYCACPSSIRWTAPEILKNPDSEESAGFISLRSDAYSFGVCMWEIVTCEDPFDEINTEQEVLDLVTEGIRPSIPELVDVLPQYRALMNQCWNDQPENRPSFKQIATKLKELVSPARTFQKNISNKLKLMKIQSRNSELDGDDASIIRYKSGRIHRDSESSSILKMDSDYSPSLRRFQGNHSRRDSERLDQDNNSPSLKRFQTGGIQKDPEGSILKIDQGYSGDRKNLGSLTSIKKTVEFKDV